ncbi:sn-glycerol-3-phosphate ABC transporter ATP-binding protein UgpC [Paenibacillus sp. SC116]|uniref:ABC transporter ATP-binding protein n=1 Tax=Paenibacillus sp. SC116 TaxID=2968986 RepID=UPI00215A1591|nr:sn-glycerol-3-phosphate ABC transporter ATP-binding protein UgpC [Paenibacillus sp. SC116]MCR8843454.1 sn-glycerol-3-phosphate ABC transporter ATP-binding protein UgpC [Paenibacillus sp. SC116]
MARVVFKNVEKEFVDGSKETFIAVKESNFTIEDKEFVVFVGPSGCGKTTSLRMIAGLEKQTRGDIMIGDRVVNKLHPKDRDIAMVFQDYALYPHMTIRENLSFGLKNLKQPKDVIAKKVKDASEVLGLDQLLDRKPKELSGGQRQRVAVGRAIVRDPQVFLFDEPLSNLDAKLRVQMRVELAELHKRLEATIVYVTHDQIEAMTLGQRIVVMNKGQIQQIASPTDLYQKPENMFVAGFIGSPPMNFMDVTYENGKVTMEGAQFVLPEYRVQALRAYEGKKLVLGIRPEHLFGEDMTMGVPDTYALTSTVQVVEQLGSENLVYFRVGERMITAKLHPDSDARVGQLKKFLLDMSKVHFFDVETEKRISM